MDAPYCCKKREGVLSGIAPFADSSPNFPVRAFIALKRPLKAVILLFYKGSHNNTFLSISI